MDPTNPDLMFMHNGPVEYVTSTIERRPGNKFVKTTRIIRTYVSDQAGDHQSEASFEGVPPPNFAADGGNDKVLSWLLQNNAKASVDDSGNSSLHEQSLNGDPQGADALIRPDYEVDVHNECGLSPLQIANEYESNEKTNVIEELTYDQRLQDTRTGQQTMVMGISQSKQKPHDFTDYKAACEQHITDTDYKMLPPGNTTYYVEKQQYQAGNYGLCPPPQFMDIPPPPNYPAPSPPRSTTRPRLAERSVSLPVIYATQQQQQQQMQQQFYYNPEMPSRKMVNSQTFPVIHDETRPVPSNFQAPPPQGRQQDFHYLQYGQPQQMGAFAADFRYSTPQDIHVLPPPPHFKPPSPPMQYRQVVSPPPPPPPSFSPPPPPVASHYAELPPPVNQSQIPKGNEIQSAHAVFTANRENYERLVKQYNADGADFPPPPPPNPPALPKHESQNCNQLPGGYSPNGQARMTAIQTGGPPQSGANIYDVPKPGINQRYEPPSTAVNEEDEPIYDHVIPHMVPETPPVNVKKSEKSKKFSLKWKGKSSKPTAASVVAPPPAGPDPPPPPPPPVLVLPPPPPPPPLAIGKDKGKKEKSRKKSPAAAAPSRGDLMAELKAANGLMALKNQAKNNVKKERRVSAPPALDPRASLLDEIKAANGMMSLRKRTERDTKRDLCLPEGAAASKKPEKVDLLSQLKASNGMMSLRRTKKPSRMQVEMGIGEGDDQATSGSSEGGESGNNEQSSDTQIYAVLRKRSQETKPFDGTIQEETEVDTQTEVPAWKKQLKTKPKKDADEQRKVDTGVPAWKKLLLEKQANEKRKKEMENQRKVDEEKEKMERIPAWKRALLEKKAAEESKKDKQESATDSKQDSATTETSNVEEQVQAAEGATDTPGKLAPWQKELKKKKVSV